MTPPLGAYLRERFTISVFGPAIAMQVVLASWLGGRFPTATTLAGAIVWSGLLVLQFRLWDDLEDRERDRATAPDRVIVRTPAEPFWRALTLLVAVNLLIASASPAAGASLVGLDLTFLCAYRGARRLLSERMWARGVLLTKYPAFVWLIAAWLGPVLPDRLAPALAAMWGCALFYEIWHQRTANSGVTA